MNLQVVRRGFDPALAHLQPGLYLAQAAAHLRARGHDAAVRPTPDAGADAVLWCLGPTSFLRDPVGKVRSSARRVVGFVPGPLYAPADLRRSLGILRWTHFRDHAVHLAMSRVGLRGFARRLGAACDAVVVPTRTLHRQLVAAGLPADQVEVVPTGLADLAGQVPGPPKTAVTDWLGKAGVTGRFVVNFGPIRPVRGVDTLVEAARALDGLKVLVLARTGDGRPQRDRAWIERRIERHGVEDRVVVHQERMQRPFLLELVRRASAAAFPLRIVQSIQPAAVHEAFQLGVPAALSDIAPLTELAEGAQARSFPVGDAPALAAALTDLVRHRDVASRACHDWVRGQPSWAAVAAKLEAMLA